MSNTTLEDESMSSLISRKNNNNVEKLCLECEIYIIAQFTRQCFHGRCRSRSTTKDIIPKHIHQKSAQVTR